MQRVRIGFISFLLSVILLLTAAFTHAAPPMAISLVEGRTYDQAHDSGYIDWSGPVQYVYLTHRDNTVLPPEEGGASCNSGCTEWVTRLGNGGTASGSFNRDASYFEALVAFSPNTNVGSATLRACSSVITWYLYNGSGSLPGFVSMGLTVPAGCRAWSLSASGGYVDYRSVDVNYSALPPTPTQTATPLPTLTSSPTQTATVVPTSTYTMTSTPTATDRATSSPTDEPSPTHTVTSTATSTPSQTSTCTPTNTFTPSPTKTTFPTSARMKTDTFEIVNFK